MAKKHHLIYLILNLVNSKIYIGSHSTYNINDNYMGSGKLIKLAIKKYGIEKFKKIILYDFDSRNKMLEKEKELVSNEFILNENVYNIALGGGGGSCGVVTVRNKKGDTFQTSVNNPEYLSGELIFISTGYVTVKDREGKTQQVSTDDPNYLNGDLKSIHCNNAVGRDKNGIIRYVNKDEFKNEKMTGIIKGTVCVNDKNGNNIRIKTDDPRLKSGELIHKFTHKVVVKDGGKNLILDRNDPRFISGELQGVTKGTIPVKDVSGNGMRVKIDDPRLESGELRHVSKGMKRSTDAKLKMSNVHKNTIWINNCFDKNKKVKADQLEKWICQGWCLGRIVDKDKLNITDESRKGMGNSSRGKKWINKSKKSVRVYVQEIDKYISDGWSLGRF